MTDDDDGPVRHNVRPELLETAALVRLDTLEHYPGNARQHDDDLLVESLVTHGQYAAIRVQRSTRFVLMGNGTYDGCLFLGWTHIAVTWIDCDEHEARKLVLIDNRSSDRGRDDPGDLAALLAGLGGDYVGTGFDQHEHARLLADIETPLHFGPDGAGMTRLDRRSVTDCPKCGHTFTPQTRAIIEGGIG